MLTSIKFSSYLIRSCSYTGFLSPEDGTLWSKGQNLRLFETKVGQSSNDLVLLVVGPVLVVVVTLKN
jgi:hypothetical protein